MLWEPTDEQNRITTCVNRALSCFNRNESFLISRDLSERCICSRFAWYLQNELLNSEFNRYVVDVEYNRGNQGNEYAPKVLMALDDLKQRKKPSPSKKKSNKIVVDLIAHKRVHSEDIGFDNLLCIEMKKLYKRPDMESDKLRLECLTNPLYGFGYKAGFMIVAVSNPKTNKFRLEIDTIYYNGVPSCE